MSGSTTTKVLPQRGRQNLRIPEDKQTHLHRRKDQPTRRENYLHIRHKYYGRTI